MFIKFEMCSGTTGTAMSVDTNSNSTRTVLVTGGCGYIGSHTIVCLLEQNYNVVVVDNLINSSELSLDRVCEIVKIGVDSEERKKRLQYYNVDLCNMNDFKAVFTQQQSMGVTFESCIHFAGLKVGFRKNVSRNPAMTTGLIIEGQHCVYRHSQLPQPADIRTFTVIPTLNHMFFSTVVYSFQMMRTAAFLCKTRLSEKVRVFQFVITKTI